jgi:hypothetical protein
MASAEIKQTSGVKLKTVKNINGRARKRHLAKPQNVSKQLITSRLRKTFRNN